MSPELEEALKDRATWMALRRMRTSQRLRDLGAPTEVVESSNRSIEKSKNELGEEKFLDIQKRLYEEFFIIEEAEAALEAAWEAKCHSCTFFDQGKMTEDSWCSKYLYKDRVCPEECPAFMASDEGN